MTLKSPPNTIFLFWTSSEDSRIFKRTFKVCKCSGINTSCSGISIVMESSIFISVIYIRPKLSCFILEMFKAFVPTKTLATPHGIVLPWKKNNCHLKSLLQNFSSLTEERASWRKMKQFDVTWFFSRSNILVRLEMKLNFFIINWC